MKRTTAERVLLVGDAACMIKPFSGGGIIYGLIASGNCADACIKALEKNEFSKKFLMKEYDKKWKKILEKPIKKGLRYRKIFDKLSDWQLDLFFNITNKLRLTKFLESFDMDLLKTD
jgi:flavin-dependent dehydrogenase